MRQHVPRLRQAALLFTDRAIYRPGHKILWKAVVYRGKPKEASYETWPRAPLTVSLMDGSSHKVTVTDPVFLK